MESETKYTLVGKANSEFNDVSIPGPAFELNGNSYSFKISPKSEFWRFGIRFGKGENAGFADQRYQNKEIKHVEIDVGKRKSDTKIWGHSNLLYLQEYHFLGPGSVLNQWDSYKPLSDIFLTIKLENESTLFITCFSAECPLSSVHLPIEKYNFFKLFAWADSLDFEIDCVVKIGKLDINGFKRIKLSPIKALSNQELELNMQDLMIFFGRNNTGKSSIILSICNYFGHQGKKFDSDYIGSNRFETSDTINPQDKGNVSLQETGRQSRISYSASTENKAIDPVYEFWIQDEITRTAITTWLSHNFEELKIAKKELDEFSSVPEVTIDGRNPRLQGTGVRMILGIVVQLFCPNVRLLCIDEPELSIEPRAQKYLFELIKSAAFGLNGVPKKNVLIATHSHIFLDKENFKNNFKVTKVKGTVDIHQIQNEKELQDAVYNLLGSDPTDLFFPANIVVVEGRSDQIFLSAVQDILQRNERISKKKVVFHFVEGIERAKTGAIAVTEMLKTQSYMPIYFNKICGLFDAPNNDKAKKVIDDVRTYFNDDGKRFAVLKQAAIEFYYPISVVEGLIERKVTYEEFTQQTETFLGETKRDKRTHLGQYFGVSYTKSDLAERIGEMIKQRNIPTLVDKEIVDLIILAHNRSF